MTIYNYHYVYRITNTKLNKHYYGSRSCNRLPRDDIGIKYFSSSYDKEFILDQKINPDNYKYKIIKIYNNRNDALLLEIKLHSKFDVGKNINFYNKAKQTTTGFDITGTILTEEAKQKMRKPKSEKGRKNMRRGPMTEEAKQKMRKPKSEKGRKNIAMAAKSRIGLPAYNSTPKEIIEFIIEKRLQKVNVKEIAKMVNLNWATVYRILTRNNIKLEEHPNKGTVPTQQTREKISLANKGKEPPNKGKKMPRRKQY